MTELDIADIGSYTVGGRRIEVRGQPMRTVSLSAGLKDIAYDPNGHYWIEQAYVQYFVPRNRCCPLPLLLVHGGGLTGSVWETTPDQRPGWLNHFLRAGMAVHVVDNVERGRAGFCAIDGQWSGQPIVRSEEEAWSLYRFGDIAGYSGRVPFEGQQFPLQYFNELTRRTVPRWVTTTAAQRAALLSIVERIGPCMLLGHSQGGGLALDVAASRPDLVHAVVALEPHGDFRSIGSVSLAGRRLLVVMGDYLDRTALWRDLGAKAKAAVGAWAHSGGEADELVLADRGLAGHSHMMMMDRASEQIAGLISAWLLNRCAIDCDGT